MHVGSIKEAEEFDTLSPEESKKRLAVLVTKMDLNGEFNYNTLVYIVSILWEIISKFIFTRTPLCNR